MEWKMHNANYGIYGDEYKYSNIFEGLKLCSPVILLMFGFLFDLGTIAIGAILPIFKTWRVLKSRKSKELVPLAKYWIVFASWVAIETVANILYLPYILPCYSLIKFGTVLYISSFGYDHLYQKTICPMLEKYQPNNNQLFTIAMANQITQITPSIGQLALTYGVMAIQSAATLTVNLGQQCPAIAPSSTNKRQHAVVEVEADDSEDFEDLSDELADLTAATVVSHEDQSEEVMDVGFPGPIANLDANANANLHPPDLHHVPVNLDHNGIQALKEMRHCSCGGGCSNKRCSCFKSGSKCNLMCHKNANDEAGCRNK